MDLAKHLLLTISTCLFWNEKAGSELFGFSLLASYNHVIKLEYQEQFVTEL
jgi:hypothetical protein